ncbi:MAG: (Fe-S)-binding protein [Deltaproteobacteria bacterium]|nr:(Fe-S)-binding protein [Deltaproteobacteria bacterium]
MISEKAVKNFTACRFCLMCRHLCPVGLKTGNEGNTPRAKALLLSYVNTGTPFSAEMAQDMYECCLCYACASGCETGFEPPAYIREARTMAVVQNVVPAGVRKVLDALAATGNLFGMAPDEVSPALREAIRALPPKAKTLLYLGGTARYKEPEIALAVIRLLQKAGVPFTVLGDEPASGAELGDLIGFVDEVREAGRQCAQAVNGADAETIVVLDPNAARMFTQQYAEWGIGLKGNVVTATRFAADLLREKKLVPRSVRLSATFQDDPVLTRELDETEPPREILAALGVDLREMFLNRTRVKSGGTALLHEYAPRIAALTGEGRWADALRTGASALLTATPDTFYVMRGTRPDSMRIQDIFVLLEANT